MPPKAAPSEPVENKVILLRRTERAVLDDLDDDEGKIWGNFLIGFHLKHPELLSANATYSSNAFFFAYPLHRQRIIDYYCGLGRADPRKRYEYGADDELEEDEDPDPPETEDLFGLADADQEFMDARGDDPDYWLFQIGYLVTNPSERGTDVLTKAGILARNKPKDTWETCIALGIRQLKNRVMIWTEDDEKLHEGFNWGLELYNYFTQEPTIQRLQLRDRFLCFVLGVKECHHQFKRARYEMRITSLWSHLIQSTNPVDKAEATAYIERGRTIVQSGVHHIHLSWNKGTATANDIVHVNRNLEVQLKMPGKWIFVKTIFEQHHRRVFARNGFEGQRIVHLFVKRDDDGNMTRRVVVKIQGERSIEMIEKVTEQEFRMHSEVSNRGCVNILDVYGSSLRSRATAPQLGYIYMDYAPYGDLTKLLDIYTNAGKQIPEAFIWVIFRGLVEALHLLLTGEAPDPDAVQQNPPQFLSNQDLRHTYPHWEPVVHRDIKVQNVVLSTSTEQYPAFKTPKLIDFGLAIRTQTHGTAGKMEMGTPAFMAPEQLTDIPQNPHVGKPINTKTDTYAIGLIILSLMNRTMVTVQKTLTFGHIGPGMDRDQCYSRTLTNLVRDCLKADPSERPEIQALLYHTKEGLRKYTKAYGEITGKSEDELPEHLRPIPFEEEDFSLLNGGSENHAGTRKRPHANVQSDAPPPKRPARAPRNLAPQAEGPVDHQSAESSDEGPGFRFKRKNKKSAK